MNFKCVNQFLLMINHLRNNIQTLKDVPNLKSNFSIKLKKDQQSTSLTSVIGGPFTLPLELWFQILVCDLLLYWDTQKSPPARPGRVFWVGCPPMPKLPTKENSAIFQLRRLGKKMSSPNSIPDNLGRVGRPQAQNENHAIFILFFSTARWQ